MTNKIYTIEEIKLIVAPIAKEHGIIRIYLFGSYARGEATSTSDLDFRAELPPGGGLYKIAEIMQSLEKAFDKQIDLVTVTPAKLEQDFSKIIANEEMLMYA